MADWRQRFQELGALWMHDGDFAKPHALLTSGRHSDGFVNCTFVTQRPSLLKRILMDEEGLAKKLPTTRVDWVIGSAFGAIQFAYAVAERLETRAGFTEKDGGKMKLERFRIEPGEHVLTVEDVISTGTSTLHTLAAIEAASGGKAKMLPEILCLVNRSGREHLEGYRLRAMLAPAIRSWTPEACPLCQAGSPAVRPKSHWKELTGARNGIKK